MEDPTRQPEDWNSQLHHQASVRVVRGGGHGSGATSDDDEAQRDSCFDSQVGVDDELEQLHFRHLPVRELVTGQVREHSQHLEATLRGGLRLQQEDNHA